MEVEAATTTISNQETALLCHLLLRLDLPQQLQAWQVRSLRTAQTSQEVLQRHLEAKAHRK